MALQKSSKINQLQEWLGSRFTPLQQLLLIGSVFRLLSVVFSKGFSWSDDHFLIIESSASWADGYFNFWLPTEQEPNRDPQGHALFYIGLHYYFFKFTNLLGITDPQFKMLLVRLIHAAWSLLMISYGYKIAEQYKGKKAAWYVGLSMAVFWFMPFISVRNLVEFVCVPAILIAVYNLNKPETRARDFILAGLWLGIAFSIRFQSVLITAGIGLALLITRKNILHILYLSLTFLAIVFLTQGVVDLVIWKKPFTEFMAYVEYNLNNATAYGTDNWHMYFDLIFGMLLPPLSILLAAGYFYSFKKTALIFWPVLVYLAFHIYFPNKQERFVMTVLPLIILSGTIGAMELHEKYLYRIKPAFSKWAMGFVIVINSVALCVLSVTYGKRHRVESMYYLYKKGVTSQVWYEDSNKEDGFLIPPLFYLGQWQYSIGINKKFNADSALAEYNRLPQEQKPEYIVFWQSENINARVDSLKKRFPELTYEKTIQAGLIDRLIYFFNPENENEASHIYRFRKDSKK